MNAYTEDSVKTRRRGFTLIESLIGVTIVTMVVGGVIGVFISIQKVMFEVADVNRLNGEVRNFSDWIGRDLRMSKGLVAGEAVYPSHTDALVIKLPPIDENEYAILDTEEFDMAAYYLEKLESGSQVLIREVVPCGISGREPVAEMIFGTDVEGSNVTGMFAAKPDALGAFVVHYRFKDTMVLRGKRLKTYISGSIKLRNREQEVNP